MKKLFSLLSSAFLYFCVATIIAQAVALASLWSKGALDRSRVYRVLAALHGVDVVTMQAQLNAQVKDVQKEQASFAERAEIQTLESLDLDLRETAIDKGLLDLRNLQTTVQVDQAEFRDQRQAYDTKLKDLAAQEQASAMKQLQRTIEAMRPAQAKEQLVKMLEDKAMGDVVTLVKNMSMDKQKKIIAEFKEGADADQLYEILKNIRAGEPVVSQIQDAREQLQR